MTNQYRKKPVVIEAWQVPPDNEETRQLPPHWMIDAIVSGECVAVRGGGIEVRTLEDGVDGRAKHVADVGDWIIQGVKGELYPCKPDIFAMTYEPVAVLQATPQPATHPAETSAGKVGCVQHDCDACLLLAAKPAEPVELSDKDISAMANAYHYTHYDHPGFYYIKFARAILAAAKPVGLSDKLDTERLDFLSKHAGQHVLGIGDTWYSRPNYGQPHTKHKSLRDAIDSAMAAAKRGAV